MRPDSTLVVMKMDFICGIVVGFVLYWYVWVERFYDDLEKEEATRQ